MHTRNKPVVSAVSPHTSGTTASYVMQKILRHIALATPRSNTHESELSRKLCCTLQRVYRTGVENMNYTRNTQCHRPICTWRNLVANSEFLKGSVYTKHSPHYEVIVESVARKILHLLLCNDLYLMVPGNCLCQTMLAELRPISNQLASRATMNYQQREGS